jgi:hypothetical protein
MRSLKGANQDATEALRLLLYLDEIDRQAMIVNQAFAQAWIGALKREPDNQRVWADLQAALFAAVVVERILRPGRVHARAGKNQAECQMHAQERAETLRVLLDLPTDSTPEGAELVAVSAVRDPLEHIDERIDGLVLQDLACISDLYISHGPALRTVPGDCYQANLRVFVAPIGVVIYDDKLVDMFKVDADLLTLRVDAIPKARATLEQRVRGRNLFGGGQLVDYSSEQSADRVRRYLSHRAQKGAPLDQYV